MVSMHMPPLEAGCFGFEALEYKFFVIKEINFLSTFQFKQSHEIGAKTHHHEKFSFSVLKLPDENMKL